MTDHKMRRDLCRTLEKQGCTVTKTKRGHQKVHRDGKLLAVLAWSPSDRRAWLNAIAILRRSGVQI